MGTGRLHNSAALWSIYTPIDCGVTTDRQAWLSTQYVIDKLPHIPVRADGGAIVGHTIATTNWMPYDWSTNNVAHEEVMNMALAFFQAGRNDEGFALLKSDILDGMFLGASPGNFGQISYYDKARSEAYRDFGDNVGISSRAIVNGLFGIRPDAMNGRCILHRLFLHPPLFRFSCHISDMECRLLPALRLCLPVLSPDSSESRLPVSDS